MLKSTYVPSNNVPPPLPAGWTEHKAPTGHTYYYNEASKESTYKRPGADLPLAPLPPQNTPLASYQQYSAVPNLANPAIANAWQAQFNPQAQNQRGGPNSFGGRGGSHGGGPHGRDRPRPQPNDKPKSKVAIPGCEPWILVYTKYGRRFAYNPAKNASYWRIPEKLMKGIIELDIQGIKLKADAKDGGETKDKSAEEKDALPATTETQEDESEEEREELGSDYEEVEVTDDEGEDQGEDGDEDGEDGHPSKRQRTEDPDHDLPVEFNEEDIAFQLQAMGEEYGLEPGEYDDGNEEDWPEGAEGLPVSETDARELFKALLKDSGVSPYSPWEKLIEDGKIIDDPRYTVLPTMKVRREVWDEWTIEQIQRLKEQRAKESKKDPRLPYMAFLVAKANPKLYWPEFRRKFKKESAMRDPALSDKDREKWYREYISRLKLPTETLKKDLTTLMRSIPAKELNNGTKLESLPARLVADVRYISIEGKTRDDLVEAYISTLGPPPE